jgi:hypothetical protein
VRERRRVVLEYGLAFDFVRGDKLHGRISFVGADAGIAAFHAVLIGLTIRIRGPLFQSVYFPSKNLPFAGRLRTRFMQHENPVIPTAEVCFVILGLWNGHYADLSEVLNHACWP